MEVVYLQQSRRPRRLPILALVDLQLEYLADGRAYHLSTAARAVKMCAVLLDEARRLRLPIAHFRQLRAEHFFNEASRFSHWVEEVRPRPSEYVYERSLPSCFSCTSFREHMGSVDQPEIILAGLSGERSCLATAIDCFQHGCAVTFVHDCSASFAFGDMDEERAHAAVRSVIGFYADVVSLRQLLERLKGSELCIR